VGKKVTKGKVKRSQAYPRKYYSKGQGPKGKGTIIKESVGATETKVGMGTRGPRHHPIIRKRKVSGRTGDKASGGPPTLNQGRRI